MRTLSWHLHLYFTVYPSVCKALSRAIYDPRYFPFPLTPPLCIHNSEFHSSFLSHLVFLRSVRWLLVTASAVPSSPILVTLMKEALSSSETSVLTRATWRNIPDDTILHSHCREILKSYIEFLCLKWKPYPRIIFHRSGLVWVLLCIWEFSCLWRVLTLIQAASTFW
jgi:hypothetical protein